MPDPMTTPGRQAAIEAAAKALRPLGFGAEQGYPMARCVIDAYEQALAEQPREERETVRSAWVRFLNDAEFHAEVHATREILSRAGIDLTRIKVATVLDCASQARAALKAEEHPNA